jgi:hypothetical protein
MVKHIQCGEYESDLKEELKKVRPAYFYDIGDIILDLDPDLYDRFQPMFGEVAYLVSNEPLTNEQLLAEAKEYLPKRGDE